MREIGNLFQDCSKRMVEEPEVTFILRTIPLDFEFESTASTHQWVRFFAAMLHEQARDIPANCAIPEWFEYN